MIDIKQKNKTSNVIFDIFNRKNDFSNKLVTHYCPGCGHGVLHKIIAESIKELNISNQTIMVWPVGCSTFGYYYFDLNSIQCPHGRAPSVATGIRKVHKDAIIIIYQGDGDLSGIGMSEIIHTASRGENLTVLFVNNAIYGMTGGQMAPTTLLGQNTVTTPDGRKIKDDGYPIDMCKILNSLDAPILIERVSISTIKNILNVKKVVTKALDNQIKKRGFSFVEILSPCPTNWKLTPIESRNWMLKTFEKVFKLGNFRSKSIFINLDNEEHNQNPISINDLFNTNETCKNNVKQIYNRKKIDKKIRIAGFGGQGIILSGVILAHSLKIVGYNATCLPSYGAEMRGGVVRSDIVASSSNFIKSPVIDKADILITLNKQSFSFYKNQVEKNGIILVDDSFYSELNFDNDLSIKNYKISAIKLSNTIKFPISVVIVMLTYLSKLTNIISIDSLKIAISELVQDAELIKKNYEIIKLSERFFNK